MFARCKFTPENIAAIEAIRFNNGEQAFRWLGWSIGDTMHIQGNASKVALVSGINWDTVLGWMGEPIQPPTLPPSEGGEEGVMMAYAKKGDKSEAVVEIQTFLVSQRYDLGVWGPVGDGADGVWGNDTTAAVASWQNDHGITEYAPVTKAPITRGNYFGPRSAGFVAGTSGEGAVGPQGPKGDKGDTGAQGPRGLEGPIGIGQVGAQGPQGERGPKGDTGSRGPKGDDGIDGARGPKGDDGIDGEDGRDGAGIEPGTVIRLATEATIL
jgi:hypothetical protein